MNWEEFEGGVMVFFTCCRSLVQH